MRSRHPSTCSVCWHWMPTGTEVIWQPGVPARHEVCPPGPKGQRPEWVKDRLTRGSTPGRARPDRPHRDCPDCGEPLRRGTPCDETGQPH